MNRKSLSKSIVDTIESMSSEEMDKLIDDAKKRNDEYNDFCKFMEENE